MGYWNEKDERLTFETQLKIEFLLPNNSSENCLEKSLTLNIEINESNHIKGICEIIRADWMFLFKGDSFFIK